MATLGVDLVIASAVLDAVPAESAAYARLGVPVLRLPADDVAEQLRRAGAALDLDARADRIAARLPARVEPPWRPRSVAAFTRDTDGRVHLVTGASPLGSLLRTHGVADPAGSGTHGLPIVPGRLSDLDAELVIGLELGAGQLGRIEADRRFAALPAVRAGRYRRLDPMASYAVCVPSVLTVGLAASVLGSVLAR